MQDKSREELIQEIKYIAGILDDQPAHAAYLAELAEALAAKVAEELADTAQDAEGKDAGHFRIVYAKARSLFPLSTWKNSREEAAALAAQLRSVGYDVTVWEINEKGALIADI